MKEKEYRESLKKIKQDLEGLNLYNEDYKVLLKKLEPYVQHGGESYSTLKDLGGKLIRDTETYFIKDKKILANLLGEYEKISKEFTEIGALEHIVGDFRRVVQLELEKARREIRIIPNTN